MRPVAGCVTLLLLITALVLNTHAVYQEETDQNVHWIKLTLGLDGEAVAWDGGVTIRDGEIRASSPWSFEQRDRFDPVAHKWFCTTVVLTGRSASSFSEPARGVLLEIRRGDETELAIETRQGDFVVDVAALAAGKPELFLDGRASAELLGSAAELPPRPNPDLETEDDFPTLAVDEQGHRWIAWIGYEHGALRDHLWTLDLDDPAAQPVEIATAREQADPQLQTDADGNLWLFWAAPAGNDWELFGVKRNAGGWAPPQQITTAAGTDFHLRTARGPDGEIWLVWQSFRHGNGDVLARRLSEGRWSDVIHVAPHEANDWEPAISIAPDGTAWIAFDSYRNGNYDVFLTRVALDDDGRVDQSEPLPVAASADFEAHASVEAGDGETIWVGCDAAGPNWGKDYTAGPTEHHGRYGEPLHASRRLILRAVVDGRVYEPAGPLPQKIEKLHPETVNHSDTAEIKRFYELPQLARGRNGRLWLLFRLNRQGYAGHPKMGAHWEFFATTYTADGWLEPLLLPISRGRQSQRVAAATGADGRLELAWSTGHHLSDVPQRVRLGRLPPVKTAPAVPDLRLLESEETANEAPAEVASSGDWEMLKGGEVYHVFFGDLHRHTDISLCTPTIDGCLVDAYRYALDGAGLDFLAVTDHTRDTDPYPWWRTQKANDLFHVPGRLAPIYGYERSNGSAGGGHRNVFFLERDWPVLRGDAHYSWTGETRPDNNNPDVALYPHLRGKQALTAAHTPAYNRRAERGTWTYNDPQVEPIAEIFQSYRHDYERPGPPDWRDARGRARNVAEEASLWYALAKGYKLGFIASSDHHATHTSFACVWATGPSRAEVFEGLSSRRTYAATDRILLDVRMGEALMGEEIPAPEVPELAIRVGGTAPIDQLQIVRNRTIVHETAPNEKNVELRYRDESYGGGAAYYYVRIRQTDNNMAWGSPIWIH